MWLAGLQLQVLRTRGYFSPDIGCATVADLWTQHMASTVSLRGMWPHLPLALVT